MTYRILQKWHWVFNNDLEQSTTAVVTTTDESTTVAATTNSVTTSAYNETTGTSFIDVEKLTLNLVPLTSYWYTK